MTALALGISRLPPTLPDIALAILTGLNAAAVGLIALAAYQLSLSAVTDKVTRGLVLLTASAGICYHAPWVSVQTFEVSNLLGQGWGSASGPLYNVDVSCASSSC